MIRLYFLLETHLCRKHCKGCYLSPQRKYIDRKADEVIKALAIISKKNLFDIRVTGSNLPAYDKIEEVLKFCNQDYLLGDLNSISTISPKKLKKLFSLGIKRIFLTSPSSCHVKYTKNKINDAIVSIKQAKMEVALTYVLDKKNITKWREMIKESIELKVNSIRFMRFMPLPNESKENFISDEELKPFIKKIYKARKRIPIETLRIYLHGQMGTWFRREKGECCFAGENLFIVGTDNIIYPCEFLMYPEFALGRFTKNSKIIITKKLTGLSRYHCKYKQIFIDHKPFKIKVNHYF